MLSAERFARRDGGRGGVKLDNCGGAGFMVGVVCKIVVLSRRSKDQTMRRGYECTENLHKYTKNSEYPIR